MPHAIRSALLAIILGTPGLATARAASAQAQAQPGASSAMRQVMVMLRMAPQHFRPDAGYGGSYGDGEGRSARGRIARRLANRQGVSVVQNWPMPALDIDCYVMTVPLGRSPEDLAASFGKEPEVSWSEPVHIYRAQTGAVTMSAPMFYNDPLYRVQPAAREWRLAELHQISTGRGVQVAVIDSMVDASQPDLADQVEIVRDFATGHPDGPEEHGTAVAGVIAAKANNGLGIVGVAPQAKIMGLRACWQQASGNPRTICDSLSLAKALDYAIGHDAQVINMSLSGPDDRLLGRLIDVALANNAVVVAAVDRAAPGGGFPADHAGVVAVAAEEDARLGSGILEAPGRDVPTTIPGARWGMENGSSFAAAHVSGLYALLKQRFPRVAGASAIVVARGGIGIDACATLLQGKHPGDCGYVRGRATLASITNGLPRNQALP